MPALVVTIIYYMALAITSPRQAGARILGRREFRQAVKRRCSTPPNFDDEGGRYGIHVASRVRPRRRRRRQVDHQPTAAFINTFRS